MGLSMPSQCRHSVFKSQVFMEYVMLRDVNDGPEQAHELGKLLQGRDVVQNLIPWNPVYRYAFHLKLLTALACGLALYAAVSCKTALLKSSL
jgi:adenine C2-methylase RlmN of 23S rRNA A2503 and tRNA A37